MTKKNIMMIIGVTVFATLLWRLDMRLAWQTIKQADLFQMMVTVSLVAFSQWLTFQKWVLMDKATNAGHKASIKTIFSSITVAGMVTPARSGDLIASMAWKEIKGKVLAWSVFHRVSEGLVTIVISFSVLGLFFKSFYRGADWIFAFIVFGTLLSCIFIALHQAIGRAFFRFIKQILKKAETYKVVKKLLSFEEEIKHHFDLFHETLATFKRKKVLSYLVSMTLINRFTIVAFNVMLFRALGVHFPLINVLGVLAAAWVGSFLAPTPNGIGIGDVAPSLMMIHYGLHNEAGAYILISRLFDIAILLFWGYQFYSSSNALQQKV